TLAHPRLGSLRQRLAVRATVEPLGIEEAADYLLHHLRAAGGKADDIIDGEALELLARHTHGIPRLLNQAAHQALLLAADAEATAVDSEAVFEALTMLGLPGEEGVGDDGGANAATASEESPLLIEETRADSRLVLPMSSGQGGEEQEEESETVSATPGRTG